jgi:hypothetical protein
MADDTNTKPAEAKAPPPILNVNVGVLGHVDSGKTSLGAPTTRPGPAALPRTHALTAVVIAPVAPRSPPAPRAQRARSRR